VLHVTTDFVGTLGFVRVMRGASRFPPKLAGKRG
jgi:hypothetical protein